MKYKYLLFDLDNTLWDFDLSQRIALENLLKAEEVEDIESYIDYYNIVNKDLWLRLEKKEITREYLVENRFKLLFKKFGKEVDGNDFARKYEKQLGQEAHSFSGSEKTLKLLTLNGYEIYAATNGLSKIQRSRLSNSSLSQYFKEVFISEEMDCQKPDVEFYEYIYEKVNANKYEMLMIGDSENADIQGAMNFGIDSVLVTKNLDINTNATYKINRIEDLVDILC